MATDTESAVPTYQQVVAAWNAQADEHNQWDALGEDEKIEWAMACAKAAPPTTGEPRWYMVNKRGMATLCTDREDAERAASDAQAEWPRLGPHRAVQLIEIGCYTPPAVVEPLTDEQIQEAILPINPHGMGYFLRIARAIEHAHGIGIKKGDSHGLPT